MPTTLIPRFTEPLPSSLQQTPEDFELSMSTFVPEIQPWGEAANQLASEMEIMYANAQAAVAALASAEWISGTTYTVGQVRWDPVYFFDYRRKTNGAGTTPPRNDPTNWALLTKTTNGGADTLSSAVDLTLTATGGRLQVISMTAASKKVKMPNATTLEKGSPVKVIKNAGLFRFSVVRDDGVFICAIEPGKIVAFSCSDTSSAAGVWFTSGDNLNIYDANAPEVVNGVDSRSLAFTMLTATKGVCAYKNNTTGFLEVVVLNFGSASGSPVVVNGEAVRNISIAAQSATQITVVYQQTNNNNVKGYVIDISGNTPIPGPVATINTAALAAQEGTGLVAMTATKLLCVYHIAGTTLRERVLDLTGNTISGISAEVIAESTSGGFAFDYVGKITSTKALAATLGSSSQTVLRLQSLTGSTPAPTGTVLSLASPSSTDVKSAFAVVIMSSLRAVIVKPVDRGAGALAIYIVDISGTSPVLIVSKLASVDLGVPANAHVYAAKMDSNRIYASWLGSSSQGVDSLVIAITSDDRIMTGPINERQGGDSVTAAAGYLSCDALDATHVMQTVRNASGFLSVRTIEIGSF